MFSINLKLKPIYMFYFWSTPKYSKENFSIGTRTDGRYREDTVYFKSFGKLSKEEVKWRKREEIGKKGENEEKRDTGNKKGNGKQKNLKLLVNPKSTFTQLASFFAHFLRCFAYFKNYFEVSPKEIQQNLFKIAPDEDILYAYRIEVCKSTSPQQQLPCVISINLSINT